MMRLAGFTALLALVAGSGTRVYAQDGAAAASVPQTAAQAEDSTAPATAEPDGTPQAPLNAGKDKKKKKKKEKMPKLTPIHIEQGTLTVDGWTGKARLNYDIADLKFIYVWAPGVGTIVASNQKFPLGKEEPGAFNGNTLTLEAAGHTIQISSEKKILKDKKPQPAYVYLDTVYKTSSAFPQMGYGNGKDAPYAWPGAKEAPVNKGRNVAPPPLPVGMRPSMARPACAPGATATAGAPPCPTSSAPAPSSPSVPAAPPVPLPGYSSGNTTATVDSSAPAPMQ